MLVAMTEPTSPAPPGMGAGAVLAGRYRVVAPISEGAMGAVHLALDMEARDHVAIKQLLDLTQLTRFQIEARLLSQLEHPRVVKVTDHFEHEGGAYLVMELVRGSDLGQLLAEKGTPGLPAADVLEWAHQTCEALSYVHAQRIVHRDVKPQNLILGDDGIVLVDFGVAREMGEADAGTIGVGTPRYMAPEVFAGGAVSERSDVFSLAATIWTLLAGGPPAYGERKPLRELCPDVPPEVEPALRAGMEFMPERRVGSVETFARALGRVLDRREGLSLGHIIAGIDAPPSLMEAIVRAAAGTFDAAAASIALLDEPTGDLVFQASWGAGAREILGVRLPPGQGINGHVAASGEPIVVADCRTDERFKAQIAAGTGYVPHTMLVVPLVRRERTIGTLSILDRRDGGAYGPADVSRGLLFADLARAALEVVPAEAAFAPIEDRPDD